MATAAVPIIGSVLGGLLGFSGAGRAGKAVANSNIAAEHGVLDAAGNAQQGVGTAVQNANTGVTNAQTGAVQGVNEATGTANNTLQAGFNGQTANLSPYLSAGQQGASSLAQYAASKPTFSFSPTDLQNDPGYQFQLGQGTAAINNSASARGLLSSGNTLEDLTKFGQGLAGTYYNDAFQRAQQQFNTNQNATLSNLSTLAGIGLSGSGQFNQASQNNTNQQAQNTLGAGYYGGNTGLQSSQFLGGLGLQGATTGGQLGLQGAMGAGNFAVGAGNATAQGILGGTNSLVNGINGVANSIPNSWFGGGGYGPAGPPPAGGGGGYG